MIEVEAKIKITNPRKFRNKISSIGKFVKKEKKIDDYYTLETLKKYPTKSLRIRKREKGYEINFKQQLSYVKGVHAKKESEFTASNLNNFLELIKDFGFKKWLRKEKISESYEINKNFHIELNKVKHLGWFLEIEYLTNKQNIKNSRKKILKVIKKLGLDKEKIIKEGYTKMLWTKKY